MELALLHLDQAGPMAQNVKDCALQEVISSYDSKDST